MIVAESLPPDYHHRSSRSKCFIESSIVEVIIIYGQSIILTRSSRFAVFRVFKPGHRSNFDVVCARDPVDNGPSNLLYPLLGSSHPLLECQYRMVVLDDLSDETIRLSQRKHDSFP
ncbi:hypothetical protein CEXT_572741 [Caerostris extrusa]|uniref:Uncharacterized protein n=1 Tax=Caerostris extrusa TaxID=172846 RepID=A0AAV4PNV2_CAEEX|nr:hypothetical protein CEXT_572741 [Caerostris extrusa]